MIQPLRRFHRMTFAAMAVILPAVFIAGLAARRPLVTPTQTGGDAPDRLLYWAQDPPAGDRLPVAAVLVDKRTAPAGKKRGYYLIYSLAWQKIVTVQEAP